MWLVLLATADRTENMLKHSKFHPVSLPAYTAELDVNAMCRYCGVGMLDVEATCRCCGVGMMDVEATCRCCGVGMLDVEATCTY